MSRQLTVSMSTLVIATLPSLSRRSLQHTTGAGARRWNSNTGTGQAQPKHNHNNKNKQKGGGHQHQHHANQGKKGNSAAQYRQQQALAAQRGGSLLGTSASTSSAAAAAPIANGVNGANGAAAAARVGGIVPPIPRFSNTLDLGLNGTNKNGAGGGGGGSEVVTPAPPPSPLFSSSPSTSTLTSTITPTTASSQMDRATFERFSNLSERLEQAKARNGTTTVNQNQQKKGKHPHTHNNNHHKQQQRPRKNGHSPPPPPTPTSPLFPTTPTPSRWGFPSSSSTTTTTSLPPPLPTMAEPGQVRMWDVDLSQRAPTPTISLFASREERDKAQRAQTQTFKQRQKNNKKGGMGRDGQAYTPLGKKRGPKLDKRLRTLTRVPLVLPHEPLTLRELSEKLAIKMDSVAKRLVRLGGREEYGNVKPESLVDLDVAELLGLELGRSVSRSQPKEDLLHYHSHTHTHQSRPDWPLRPPVVCVMGHVDHGKTTLLDALRKTKVAKGEAGGITQRLGAFHIPLVGGAGAGAGAETETDTHTHTSTSTPALGVTVLDTPGHAAFSAMRVNGALATDIVLLVVSATDGLQEQTLEVLQLLSKDQDDEDDENTDTPTHKPALMVAITKTDKLSSPDDISDATDKITHALASHGIMTENLGGDVQVVPVSATTGTGLNELTERLQLQAEILELRADRHAPAEGVILDAYVDKGLGVCVNVLVRWGALGVGDYVVAGEQWGRVKKIMGEGKDDAMEKALPSIPVRVLGLKELPSPGEGLIVVKTEERAQAVAEARRAAKETQRLEEMEAVKVLAEDDEEQLNEVLQRGLMGQNTAGKKTKAFLALQRGAVEEMLINSRNKEAEKALLASTTNPDGTPNTNTHPPTNTHTSTLNGNRRAFGNMGGPVIVPFFVKADGKGTLDAAVASIAAYESEIIRAEVIGTGCGAVTEGDLEWAKAAGAAVGSEGKGLEGGGEPCTILAFGVGFAHVDVAEMARREGVSVCRQSVIYSLLDDVKATLQKHMPMEKIETPIGKLEVQQTFTLTGKRRAKNTVAGCKVVSGSAFSAPQYRYRVKRGDVCVCDESPPATLYHFKEQVQEVKKGSECGLVLEGYGEFEQGDVVEVYTVERKPKALKEVFGF